jgi:YVTN family beta-propeller protein
MPELHGGTVTFLFTDIEGSTRLLQQLGDRYSMVLADQRRILRAAAEERQGREIDTQGDSFFFAFARANAALGAAVVAQRALAEHDWPEGAQVRVRMGLHTGEPLVEEQSYVGLGVHRAARIGAAAHGGQVLLSNATRELVADDVGGVSVRELGSYRLKDIDRPELLFQLDIEGLQTEFPPLRAEKVAKPRPPRRRAILLSALAGVIAAAIAIPVFALGQGGGGSAVRASVDADSVGVFDARSGKPVVQASVKTGPSAIAAGEGAVWVANINDNSVSRIDPQTNASVDTIPVGKGPAGIAVGGGFVWVTNGLEGTLSKIDPGTNTRVQTITVGNGPSGVAYGEGAVWVANSTDRTVTKINPVTGARTEIPVRPGADGIAVGDGAVWVTSESAGSVTRIDPRAGIETATINVGRGAEAVATSPGAVWVANGLDGTVSRIDPSSNAVRAVITVGDGPSGVAVTPDGTTVWVSSALAGTLSQIVGDEVVRTKKIGNRPEDVALSGGRAYLAVKTSGLVHRGGTLTVLQNEFESVDPAATYGGSSILTNDGLVAYKRIGGSGGTRLVPDLTTSIPIPTDDGKRYTFQVRRGIHYSNGALVRPADFRRAIERSAGAAGTGFYFSIIVGFEACLEEPDRCDLSKGIETDSTSNTVTFHLRAPDPDFLLKLALPAGFAVPAGTPLKARLPLPATGPYMIARYEAKRGARLVRNPHFHVWYEAAQPDGYPDEIDWRFNVLPDVQRRAVEQGKADVAIDAAQANEGTHPSPALLATLRTRYASLLHINPQLAVFGVFLNTRVPPFDDVRVRRAVNYAVDRHRMDDLRGGPDRMQPSCQVLPPNIDGYRRYCPYTVQPSPDGSYTGPDLAKARRLVAASGTKGQEVTVAGIAGIFQPHGGDYFVSVLRSLGYRPHFRNFKDFKTYFESVGDSRRKIQSGIESWFHDYPTAGNFLPYLLSCSSFLPNSTANQNRAEFCNRSIDADIARARSLQATDPGAASRLWRKVDHDIVRQAPWVFLQNPTSIDLVSRRVGNYQYNPQWGILLDQLWVK